MTTTYLGSALAGLGLGLGLIVAIGAQNAFVLRQGIRREQVLPVVLICIASDAALIVAGVGGAGAIITAAPALVTVARWGGALFLLGYAVLAARRALRRPAAGEAALRVNDSSHSGAAGPSADTVVATALALTWLNPHVYLDTVVLLGSVGSSHGHARWAFAGGAVLGSTLWFAGLGLGARALAPVFARPNAWRVLDALIAAIMATLAVGLVLSG